MNNDFYINISLSFRILWSPFTSTHVNVNVLLKNSSISLFGAALAGLDLLIEVALLSGLGTLYNFSVYSGPPLREDVKIQDCWLQPKCCSIHQLYIVVICRKRRTRRLMLVT